MNLADSPLATVLDLREPRGFAPRPRQRLETNRKAAELLERLTPAIAELRPGAELSPEDRKRLMSAISTTENIDRRVELHRVVDFVIIHGNATGLWQIQSLGLVAQHALAASAVRVEEATAVVLVEAWRAKFMAELPELLGQPTVERLTGALVFSLAVNDALLVPQLLRLAATGDCVVGAQKRAAWLTFNYAASTDKTRAKRCRRWLLGEVSSVLLQRLDECEGAEAVKIKPDSALAAFSVVLDMGLPTNVESLVKTLLPWWSAHLPPALMMLTTRANATESLPDTAFRRLAEGIRVPATRASRAHRRVARARATETRRRLRNSLAEPSPDAEAHMRAYRKLRPAVYWASGKPRPGNELLKEKFASWHAEYDHLGGWVVVLARWLENAVLGKREAGNEKNLALGSAYRYLSSFGAWFIRLATDLDPGATSASELMQRLEVLQTAISGLTSAPIAHGAIAEFLNFAHRHFGGPDVDLVDWWGAPPKQGRPDANLLTPREFARLLAWLDKKFQAVPGCHDHCRARVIAILCFRIGFRWGELRAMPLRHVRVLGRPGQEEVSLAILPSAFGDPKTANCHRRVQLDKLLPADELDEVVRFLCDVAQGRFWQATGDALVFASPDAPLQPSDAGQTRDLVQEGMRAVSGDATLVFHHLRHAACCFVFLRLLPGRLPGYINDWPEIDRVQPSAFDYAAAGFESYGDWLNRRHADPHVVWYGLSQVAGHIDPEVTFEHYIHLSEIAVHLAATSLMKPLSVDALVALRKLKNKASAYQMVWRGDR